MADLLVFCCLCRPLRGLARSHRGHHVTEDCAEPVGAGKPAKRPAQATKCLAICDVKVAIHCFNQPYAACEYQRHDSRPAHRPTAVPPFAAEGPAPCR
ncbi:hypothetical protein D0O09_18040 [Pseudomonas putida]|nr:hypothetical protein D0O09_18040 [Pseudomonas putida]